MVPSLEPIEKPNGDKMQSTYRMTRQQLGKVMTPINVAIARIPGSMELDRKFNEFRANCTGPR